VSRVIVDNNPKRRLSENSPPQPSNGIRFNSSEKVSSHRESVKH